MEAWSRVNRRFPEEISGWMMQIKTDFCQYVLWEEHQSQGF
jgi:hypothetical protein